MDVWEITGHDGIVNSDVPRYYSQHPEEAVYWQATQILSQLCCVHRWHQSSVIGSPF